MQSIKSSRKGLALTRVSIELLLIFDELVGCEHDGAAELWELTFADRLWADVR